MEGPRRESRCRHRQVTRNRAPDAFRSAPTFDRFKVNVSAASLAQGIPVNQHQDASVQTRRDALRDELLIGVILAAIAVSGPLCGLIFGSGGSVGGKLMQGWYSAPMALFALPPFLLSIRSQSDYLGGAVLATLGFFALWAASGLPGMKGYSFGSGTAPTLFAYALVICGAVVSIIGIFNNDHSTRALAVSAPLGGAILLLALIPVNLFLKNLLPLDFAMKPEVAGAALSTILLLCLAFVIARFTPRGPIFITTAILIFAIAIRPLGLVTTSFVSIVVVSLASNEMRWVETFIWASVLTAGCALLFSYTLRLPLHLWPQM